MIEFTVHTVPVAQPRQRHRVVHSGGRAFATNYTPAKDPVNAFKAVLQLAARQTYQGPLLDEPLVLMVGAYFPRPKRLLKKDSPRHAIPYTKKPDGDNVLKAIKDALNGVIWRDDQLVYHESIARFYVAFDDPASVVITIFPSR